MHSFQICWLDLFSQEERESAVPNGDSGVHDTLGVTFTEQTKNRDMCAEKGSFKAKCIDDLDVESAVFSNICCHEE